MCGFFVRVPVNLIEERLPVLVTARVLPSWPDSVIVRCEACAWCDRLRVGVL